MDISRQFTDSSNGADVEFSPLSKIMSMSDGHTIIGYHVKHRRHRERTESQGITATGGTGFGGSEGGVYATLSKPDMETYLSTPQYPQGDIYAIKLKQGTIRADEEEPESNAVYSTEDVPEYHVKRVGHNIGSEVHWEPAETCSQCKKHDSANPS